MTLRARLLLADDHPILAEGLKSLLTPHHEVLEVVSDGHTLLARALDLRPDLIVADISMPRLSGFEVLSELRSRAPTIPVLILTMYDDAAYARRAMDLGASAFLPKHALPADLHAAIQVALSGGTYLYPSVAASIGAAEASELAARQLTPRQRGVLRLIGQGRSVKAIAAELGISPRTVEFHKYQMMAQLGIRTAAELICLAHRVEPPDP